MELVIWLVAAYGMSQILVYGSIFNGFRDSIHRWGENKLLPLNFLGSFLSGLIIGVFFDGMLASGGVWIINTIVDWFEETKSNG